MTVGPLSAWLFATLVLAVGFERVAELVLSRRHVRWALARGGYERGKGHYPVMVVLHAALLLGAVVEVWWAGRPFLPMLGWPMLILVLAAQGLRWWCIATLGTQWNTRVVVVPGLPRVRRGPYRLVAHPNYVAVAVEGLALPLVHTAWVAAGAFTLVNAALLALRIRVEESALADLADLAVAE